MRKIDLYHDIWTKIDWSLYVIICLMFISFIIYCLIGIIRFWGEWQHGAYTMLILLVLPGLYLMTLCAIERKFVWSKLTIDLDNLLIIQNMFKKKIIIDLKKPWEKSYKFIFRSSKLYRPRFQFVEIQQNDNIIQFIPNRLIPKISLEILPESLKDLWKEFPDIPGIFWFFYLIR
jgi:hypothetical protein